MSMESWVDEVNWANKKKVEWKPYYENIWKFNLAVSLKIKYKYAIYLSNTTHVFLPPQNLDYYYKDLHINIHNFIFHNSPKMQTT